MNRSKSSTSCVSLHVTVQNSQNKVLFNKMFKVDVHNDKCMLETVQAAFTVIKPDIHAPTELLEVGEKMLRVSVAAANKRQTVESVLMPLNDCALVSAHGADVSEYGWNGMRHEGVLEVRCENVHLRTQVHGVHLRCTRAEDFKKTEDVVDVPNTGRLRVQAPTGIPTIKQTPKNVEGVNEAVASRDFHLRVGAWLVPNTDTSMPKQIHHFLSVNQVLQPLSNVLRESFGRATLNNFQVSHSMSHRDKRQWTKAEHLAAATNVLGPVSGLNTTKRHSLNFMVWRTAVRVGESRCEFFSLVL